MSELLPCPFCGGEADIERTEERFEYGTGGPNSVMEFGYYTYCTRCDASIGLINVPTSDRDMAIHEWNRRTPPTPTVPLDMPDSAGWWAFEGHVLSHLGESVKLTWVVDVSLNGIDSNLYAHSTSGHSKPVKAMVGKWWKLSMPWDAAKEGGERDGE